MKYQELGHLLSDQQNPLTNINVKPIAVGPPYLDGFRVDDRRRIQIAPRVIVVPQLLIVKPLSVNKLISFVYVQTPFRVALRVVEVEKPCLVVQHFCRIRG